MTATSTDRIEKKIQLRAPRSRVWRALTNSAEFGQWFGSKLDGEFQAGKAIRGTISCKGYEGLALELVVERIEPERLFSYRWHPYAVDAKRDYSREAHTLVEFTLSDMSGGTLLTVVESGFDKLPPERRDEAFRMNSNGWAAQLANIERHVGG